MRQKLGGGEREGGGNLGIEGRKKFWKNHFYKLSKTNFLMPLVQIWCNSPNNYTVYFLQRYEVFQMQNL